MKARITLTLLSLALLLANGCIYSDVRSPLDWRSATPVDVPGATPLPYARELRGKSCNHQVLGLVAWGDGGFDAAVKSALRRDPEANTLYDVKSDTQIFNILLVYSEICTRVRGKPAKL